MNKFQVNELYRRRNYDICMAVDLIKLGIVLEEMVTSEDLSQKKADSFKTIAQGLLQLIRQENDKLRREFV